MATDPQELYVTHNGVDLYVKTYGDDSKPTLMFLHGYPDCHLTWQPQIDALKKDYHLILFDMRGVGLSSIPEDKKTYQMRHLLSDINAILDATVPSQKPIHLIGHDWGSSIGWGFVCHPRYKHRVASYTSMSGPHLGLTAVWLKQALTDKSLTHKLQFLQQLGKSWYIYFFNIPYVSEQLLKINPQGLRRTFLTRNGVSPSDPYLSETDHLAESMFANSIHLYRKNALNPKRIPEPYGISTPVQILIAEDDAYVSQNLYGHYDQYFTQLEKISIPAKHWMNHSHSELVNARIKAMVESVKTEETLDQEAMTPA